MRPDYNSPRDELWEYIKELEFIAGIKRDKDFDMWVANVQEALRNRLKRVHVSNGENNNIYSPQVARLLVSLSAKNEVLPYETLLQRIKKPSADMPSHQMIINIISRARKAFTYMMRPNPIVTIHGFGAKITDEARIWVLSFKPGQKEAA
jgi:hypothetical protein